MRFETEPGEQRVLVRFIEHGYEVREGEEIQGEVGDVVVQHVPGDGITIDISRIDEAVVGPVKVLVR